MQVALNIPAKFEGLLRPARYKVYFGGRGGGKTENIAQVLIALSVRKKLLILCTRMYQNSISDSVYRVLVYWIYELKLEKYFDIQKNTIICRTTGSEFIFKGLQRNISEVRSMKGVNIIWVDEAHSVTMDAWLFIDPTIRENNSEVWISYNPDKEDDATHVRFVIKAQPDSIIVPVNWYDNPYFPPVLEKLRQNMLANDLDNYGWVWEGECRKITEAAVYNKKLTIKTFDDPPSDTRFYHGLDFGFSVDPTVLIRCWTAPSTEGFNEDIYIDREAYGHQIELDEMPAFFDATVETARNWHIKADNARPECISYLSRQGYGISAAEKWVGCVEDGIAHMRAFRNIIIHETRCPNTVRDFRLYSYKVDKRTVDENGKPQVLPILEEKNDHAPDSCISAGTFIDTDRGHIPIEDVLVGDRVRTRKGYKRVYHTQFMGNKPVWRIISNNRELLATGDHKVFSSIRGWTPIQDMRYTDDVLFCGSVVCQNERRFSLTRLLSIVTPKASSYPIAYILWGRVRAGICIFTGLSGNIIGERFQKVFTFTTNMKMTLKLLILKDLIASPALSMSVSMRDHVLISQKYVSNAQNYLRQSKLKHQTETVFVPTLVNLLIDGCKVLITRSATVLNAVKNLLSIATRKQFVAPSPVQCIENTDLIRPVYDLSVEDQPEFFANGILVHNCRYALDGLIQQRGGIGVWQRLMS